MPFPTLAMAQSPLRDAISAACHRDERAGVRALLDEGVMPPAMADAAQALAHRFVERLRAERSRGSGIDALMREFALSTDEGIALMCLAEALLRIPDRDTADRLIHDKIARGDWRAHLGRSASLFINAAAWGLYVSGTLTALTRETGLGAALGSLIAKGGEPLIRAGMELAMRLLGGQFVMASTIEEALEAAAPRVQQGYRYSFDMLGEAAMTRDDAERYTTAYEAALMATGRHAAREGSRLHDAPGVSVKLSALHPRYCRAQRDRVLNELLPRLRHLFLLAHEHHIGLSIDAEEADRLELSLDLIEAIALDPALRGFEGIGVVLQAYQKRCPAVIDWLGDLARRSGHRFMVRLVKGAYWDSDIKRAQVAGISDYPVYTRKVYTDVSYIVCARRLLAAPDAFYPQFATHNAHTVAALHTLAGDAQYEFQCLHGMGETLYDRIVGADGLQRPCRIYAPVGAHAALLPYLVRRLLENGANSSFVNRLLDESVSIEALTADPFALAAALDGAPHPLIALPRDLYRPTRLNSPGVDLADECALRELDVGLRTPHRPPRAMPTFTTRTAKAMRDICDPADRRRVIGTVADATPADIDAALTRATEAAAAWGASSYEMRATLLENAAARIDADRAALVRLIVREAGRTIANAIGEIREAADFCRYYAAQLRAGFDGTPTSRGPTICISPWNFPVAIFTGQISAALGAGNPVIAKPAEQTPLAAARIVAHFHRAGFPREALQLLPGDGAVGAALVADPRVRGVLLTGSTAVAKSIEQTLARREDVLLVAETGGQNAMIVDSSALIEQVVADALLSAFDSAGQRCSALRVLYVQTDIAEQVLAMLRGAMDELRVGDPARLQTDVGPVIDESARRALLDHIDSMRAHGFACHSTPLHPEAQHGSYVAPTLIEIDDIARLPGEVFGPVLHVIRYPADQLNHVIDAINATGYGLTHGIHSRIDETVAHIADRVRAGNLYVNRNIIGAVVGVQPFGGEGRSGTGPKAGGPLYLPRLMRGARPRLPTGSMPPPSLHSFAQGLARMSLAAQERAGAERVLSSYARMTPYGTRVPLPGPTGESNELYFAPRGAIGCLAATTDALIEQVTAVLATDNHAVLLDGGTGARLADIVPERVTLVADMKAAAVGLLLWDGVHPAAPAIHRALMAQRPAIVPCVLREPEGYDPYRLMVERSLCINTAAAGGNAALMTLNAPESETPQRR